MSNATSKQILNEMIELGVDIVRYIELITLPRSVNDQLTKAVTSIGANYSEAQNASSKRDFLNKIYIAKKEAAETVYWLQFVQKLTRNTKQITGLEDRAQRFVMILQKITNSTRRKSLQDKG